MEPASLAALPSPELRPFVKRLWASCSHGGGPGARENVLPTGLMHLVFRLSGPALRVFGGPGDLAGYCIAEPVVGGARSSFYTKDISAAVSSVGAQLLPGAAQALFGVAADELAERHTPLSQLWGTAAFTALEQLRGARDAARQLNALDSLLLAMLRQGRGIHPAVAHALGNLDRQFRVQDLVLASGYSHRGFIALFRQATGLSPKRYANLMQFQQLLAASSGPGQPGLAQLALAAGYSDQAHMTREFRRFAGLTPLRYRQLAPSAPHHVALGGR